MTTPERIRRRQRIETTLVVIAMILVGVQQVYFNLDERAEDRANEAAERADDERREAELACVTSYALDLTDALRDRDAVATVTRGAQIELWVTFGDLVENPRPAPKARGTFLAAKDDFLRTLRRLDSTVSLNPYPDPRECFKAIKPVGELAIRLVAYHGVKLCFGQKPTIRGTKNGDVLQGTNRRDVIVSFSGPDLIVAAGRRDRICSGPGADVVNGGRGFDRVNCGKGVDLVQSVEYRKRCETSRR